MAEYTSEELLKLGKETNEMDFAVVKKPELLPCPFCGSERIYVGQCNAPYILKKYKSGYFAGCMDCKITTSIYRPDKTRSPLLNKVNIERERQRAIDDWNTRTPKGRGGN